MYADFEAGIMKGTHIHCETKKTTLSTKNTIRLSFVVYTFIYPPAPKTTLMDIGLPRGPFHTQRLSAHGLCNP